MNFVHWKDREEPEEVYRKANLLKGFNIYITEDLSRKVREHRMELQKYARQGSTSKDLILCLLQLTSTN